MNNLSNHRLNKIANLKSSISNNNTTNNLLTIENVKQSLPSGSRIIVEQSLVDKLNNINSDPLIAKEIRTNFISYAKVINSSRYKVSDYLNAVAYATHKSRGLTNRDAYVNTFPNRYQTLMSKGLDEKQLSSYVSMYNSNELVRLILEQSLIPIRILYRDAQADAINTLIDLTQSARSEMVRCQAANSLLTHLKEPESSKIELQIGLKEDAGLSELKETVSKLAELQLNSINSGKSTTKDIAHQKIINITKDDFTIDDIDYE